MKTAGNTWERRWIAERLPSRFEAGALSATLGAPSSAIHECDAYLLTESARINLKVRRRGSRPKLKILHGRADDQREHSGTRIDAPLPTGAEAFREVLALLRGGGDADRLGAALSADEVMELRGAILEPDRMVAMSKTRQLFQQRNCRIDLVRFHAHGHHAGSLGIESPSESDLRALVHGMDLHTIGASRIYMDFLYGTPQV